MKYNLPVILLKGTVLIPQNELKLEFEDGEFMCFSKWDEYLECTYGDYMTLPPEGEREWKHHPIILDD